jgi:predicted nucleic acid-binding protein
MIILDTKILSEPTRPAPSPAIIAWLDAQDQETLFTTTITAAEIFLGLQRLPIGQRRASLEARMNAALAVIGEARTLPFTLQATRLYAVLAARIRATGYIISALDAQIAAIAALRGFAIATRDTAPFIAAGLPVINPWST